MSRYKKMYLITQHDYDLLNKVKGEKSFDAEEDDVRKKLTTTTTEDVNIKNAIRLNDRLTTEARQAARRRDVGLEATKNDDNDDDDQGQDVLDASVEDNEEGSSMNTSYVPLEPSPVSSPHPTRKSPVSSPHPTRNADSPPPLEPTPPVIPSKFQRRTRATTPLDASFHSLSTTSTPVKTKKPGKVQAAAPLSSTGASEEAIYNTILEYLPPNQAAKGAILARQIFKLPNVRADWGRQSINLDNVIVTVMQFADLIKTTTEKRKPGPDIERLDEFVAFLRKNELPSIYIINPYIKTRLLVSLSTSRQGAQAMAPILKSPISSKHAAMGRISDERHSQRSLPTAIKWFSHIDEIM